jgi:hypothetical protein
MNLSSRNSIGFGLVIVCGMVLPPVGSAEETRGNSFRDAVAPILIRNCLECHHGAEPSGGLDLTSAESLGRGGESGQVIQADDLRASLLWQQVSSGEMPPESKLSETDRNEILRWVAAGAPWGDHTLDPYSLTTDKRAGYDWWSLQPIVDPPVPDVGTEVRNPIDAFVIKRLRSAGLSMSPRADARTLARRLSVRLHGIHPDPETVERLDGSDMPKRFDALVSEYLNSHRYGERWARHWLDLARFGESQGFERDKSRPHAWRYRDWVIDALNDDMPYDEFARMQIAGDCIPEAGRRGVIATGFMVAGAYDEVGQGQQSAAMKAVVRQDEMEDYVGTVGQTFLGLTTNCARCHDHKFDPIRQSEYYALCSALDGVRHGDREIMAVEANRAAEKGEAQTVTPEFAYAVKPTQPKQPMRLLLRGNTATPGDVVVPAGLASLQGTNWDFELPADAPEAERRRMLAEWITSRTNPLFARVIVNRLWQHHFDAGFVSTPNDFGFTGGQPSHPELLDYLAARLIESNWSLKSIHRLIVTSATWQQATTHSDAAAKVDSGNRLLWRGNRTRLDAESLRDSILLAAGQLNDQVGGPSFQDFKTFNFNSQFYEMTDPIGEEFNRRTIYRMVIRSGRNRMLDAFDCPDPSATAPKRAMTTTPLQALSLLNHSFALRMADHFAERVADEVGDEAAAQIDRAVRIAWCREPTESERKSLVRFTKQHGLPSLCRVLLNSNEFLYVD